MIIGLSGYARSGKDSAAEVLLRWGWRRDSFADRLRAFLYALDPVVSFSPILGQMRLKQVVDLIGWERAKESYPEVRHMLQRCGTEAGRRVLGQDVWVDSVFKDYRPGEPLVISDVRFPNEANRIRSLGWLVVRINRPGVGPKLSADGAVHESETAMDDYQFDAVLENDGTVDDLQLKVIEFVRSHRNGSVIV